MTNEERDAIRQRLSELEISNGGRLTPDAVLNDAKKADSLLHSYFEWDNKKAALQHRLDQARSLITSVRVIQKTETSVVRTVYYVRDPSAAIDQQGYVSIDKLRSDGDMAREALVQEFSRAADLLRRARQLAKALEIEPEIEALIDNVVGLRQRVLQEGAAA